MRFTKLCREAAASAIVCCAAGAARAQDMIFGLPTVGEPHPRGLGFQPASSVLARDQQWLDHMLLAIITAICVFVFALLVYVMIRFNAKANPKPARFTHNTPLEIAWTLIPIVILVVIGAFSLPTLWKQQEIPKGDIVVKVTGSQWFWSYEYPDEGISFDAMPLEKADLESHGYTPINISSRPTMPSFCRRGKTIVMQLTALDVIHSWTIPAFAVKQDAVPGRIAQLWFDTEREGVFFGQCSELCGQGHAYMPIVVKVVPEAIYARWLERAKAGFPQGETINADLRGATRTAAN